MAEQALSGAAAMEEEGALSVAFYLVTVALALGDRLSTAESLLDRAEQGARERGSLIDLQSSMCLRAWAPYRRGRLRDAEADARLALDRAPAAGADVLRAWKLAVLGEVWIERGELEEARSVLSPAELGPYDDESILYQPFRDARARLCLVSGEAEEALEHLRAEDSWSSAGGCATPAGPRGARTRSRPIPLSVTKTRRRALAADELERLGFSRTPRARDRPSSLRNRRTARRHRNAGGGGGRAERLGGAPRTCPGAVRAGRGAASGRRPRQGSRLVTVSVGYGRPLRRDGVLADRVRDELHLAGARPRRERISGLEALTAQERRVLDSLRRRA